MADIALTSDDEKEGEEALAEGEALLAGGCVSASHIEFHIGAIESALRRGAWEKVERHAAALEAYTSEEPLPLTDFLIERGRALMAIGRDGPSPEGTGRVWRLCEEARRFKFLAALPALEGALSLSRQPD